MGRTAYRAIMELVCLYAYGPCLAKRITYMKTMFKPEGGTEDCPQCKECTNWDGLCDACGWCDSGEQQQRPDATTITDIHPFFALLARHILVLRFPQRFMLLQALGTVQKTPLMHNLCYGCLTYSSSAVRYISQAGYCPGCRRVVACTDHNWCRPERLGRIPCPCCRRVFCRQCIEDCSTCGDTAACAGCLNRCSCEDSACVVVCPEHAPQRVYSERRFVCETHDKRRKVE